MDVEIMIGVIGQFDLIQLFQREDGYFEETDAQETLFMASCDDDDGDDDDDDDDDGGDGDDDDDDDEC